VEQKPFLDAFLMEYVAAPKFSNLAVLGEGFDTDRTTCLAKFQNCCFVGASGD
jgi:hypothetical protein